MSVLRWLAAWLGAIIFVCIRNTCRLQTHDDPRPGLRGRGQGYIYAILHAHQIAAVLTHGEELCGTMVSRSVDGDLIIPICTLNNIRPFRGSSSKKGQDKGGTRALTQLIEFVRSGRPCTMAVDGPRGPRNHVQGGVAKIAEATGAHIVVTCVIPRRRWILRGTWDRMQIPGPFSTFDAWFSEPIGPGSYDDLEMLRARVEDVLTALERSSDPSEATIASRLVGGSRN